MSTYYMLNPMPSTGSTMNRLSCQGSLSLRGKTNTQAKIAVRFMI